MLHVPLHITKVIDVGGVSLWASSVCCDKIITNPLWDILATGVAVIKLKHIKLGKPDTQEHYPSKAEGTSAAAQQGTSERAAPPEAKARRPPTETTGTYKSKCTMEKGVRRLIRKPEKPHGKNWERIPQPMQSHKTSGG